MRNKEIRAKAREALYDNWGKYIGLNFLYFLMMFALALLSFIPIIGSIGMMICTIPLAYGYVVNFVKIKKGETVRFTEFLNLGFSNFGRSWALYGWTIVKLILPVILFFAVYFVLFFGIILGSVVESEVIVLLATFGGFIAMFAAYIFLFAKALLYIYPQYIAAYNSDMLPKECVEHSAKIMKGHRLKYIGLTLSFFGWMILASLTCGIGYIFLLPYMTLAFMCFYEDIDKENLQDDVPNIMGNDNVNEIIEKKQTENVVVENN